MNRNNYERKIMRMARRFPEQVILEEPYKFRIKQSFQKSALFYQELGFQNHSNFKAFCQTNNILTTVQQDSILIDFSGFQRALDTHQQSNIAAKEISKLIQQCLKFEDEAGKAKQALLTRHSQINFLLDKIAARLFEKKDSETQTKRLIEQLKRYGQVIQTIEHTLANLIPSTSSQSI